MTDHVEIVVAGAGAVGLAIARALAQAGREVLVLEASEGIGTVTSSRNSEVVHAGIYYPQGSLKAALCVEGRERLYEFCASHGVPVRRLTCCATGIRIARAPTFLLAIDSSAVAAASAGT